MKQITLLVVAFLLLLTFSACGNTNAPQQAVETPAETEQAPAEQAPAEPTNEERIDISIGVLNGATGISVAALMEEARTDSTFHRYHFTVGTAPDQVAAMLVSGEIQIAALPTNLAATLYQRTEGGVQMIALTTWGVLHILENGDSISEIADLRGQTIHTTGEGANPEFILNHILIEHGLIPGQDVTVEFHPNEALASLMASGEIHIAMVPEPMASSILMQNSDVRRVIDVTEAWRELGDGSELAMSAFVARRDFVEEHEVAVWRFLSDLHRSIAEAHNHPVRVGELIAYFDILPNAQIATAAIPYCNLTFKEGLWMQPIIMGYFEVLYRANPQAIGGALPSENFFLIP